MANDLPPGFDPREPEGAPRQDCPLCEGRESVRHEGWKQTIPHMFILHCVDCDTYIAHAGYCPTCGKGNFFTDGEVDQALSGTPIPCSQCKEPYIPPHWQPANVVGRITGTLLPDLAVRLDMPSETSFVEKAQQAVPVDDVRLLGVFHASTAYRIVAARRHLRRLSKLDPPFGIVTTNYTPTGGDTKPRDVTFDLRIFDYLMNARSAADTLAHEATVVMRTVLPNANLADPADPDSKLSFHNALEGLSSRRPLRRLFLKTEDEDWFKRLHALRNISFHRQVLLQQATGSYQVRKLRGIRPVQLEPDSVVTRLPDNPADPFGQATHSKHPDVRQDLGAIQKKLEQFIDSVYALLAVELDTILG